MLLLDATLALSHDHGAAAASDWSVASCSAESVLSVSRSQSLPTSIFSYPLVRRFCTRAYFAYARAMALRHASVVCCLRS
jgi:hypothetical protein